MRSKEFREIQVSSSALVVIFLGILVLGVFIFLLGVSVGKKQAQITPPSVIIAEKSTSPPAASDEATPDKTVFQERTPPAKTGRPQDSDRSSPLTTEKAGESRQKDFKPAVSTRKASSESTPSSKNGRYYIQVGAFTEKTQASNLASKFMERGYSVVVVDPLPTDRKAVYRVRLGGYADSEQASLALARLNSAAAKKTGYFVVKD